MNSVDTQERIQREKEFHDISYSTDLREQEVGRFYRVAQRSYDYYYQRVLEGAEGTRVLEIGCGKNSAGLRLAKLGASVAGIDVSRVAIDISLNEAREAGLSGRVDFIEMDAEAMEFPDETFDLVCGIGILHHLNLDRGYPEIRRVLKPGGRAVFHEGLGHNPLINAYRNRTPHLRTPDEHPLLLSDIAGAKACFSSVRPRYFHVASLALVPVGGTPLFKPLYALTEGLDRLLMTLFPPVRRWAWISVIELTR